MGDVRIERVDERVDDLAPMWKALQSHHRSVDPAIDGIPPRDADESWPRRRANYLEWLTHPDAFVLIAQGRTNPVGDAFVSIHEPADDTHVTNERWAELQTLVVLPDRRGGGLGGRLMEQTFAELRSAGIEQLAIGVMATNDRALRFYERHGFRPWVITTLGTVPPAPADR
jgi:ribosomal protein S18 acetylase RimI-like enzyme